MLGSSVYRWPDDSRLRVAEGGFGSFESADYAMNSRSGVHVLLGTVQTADCTVSVGCVLQKKVCDDVEQHWSFDSADTDWLMSVMNDCCSGRYAKQDLSKSAHCSAEVTGKDTGSGGCFEVVAEWYCTDTAPDYFSQCDRYCNSDVDSLLTLVQLDNVTQVQTIV